eukprot:750017-Hanusia_phi.AAC.1
MEGSEERPVDNVHAAACSTTQNTSCNSRLNFKRQPGQDGFKRRVVLAEAMLSYCPDKIFGTKDKLQLYTEVTTNLNKTEQIFCGQLKTTTTRDKWLEVMKVVDDIIKGGEEKYIRATSNGRGTPDDLDRIHLRIAKMKSEWMKACHQARTLTAAEPSNASPVRDHSSQAVNLKRTFDGASVSQGSSRMVNERDSPEPCLDNSNPDTNSDSSSGSGTKAGSAKQARLSQAPTPARQAVPDNIFGEIVDFFKNANDDELQCRKLELEVAKVKAMAEAEVTTLNAAATRDREKAALLKQELEVSKVKLELANKILLLSQKGVSVERLFGSLNARSFDVTLERVVGAMKHQASAVEHIRAALTLV